MTNSEVVIYSKPDCLLCDELKDLLRGRGIPFEERSIVTRLTWFRLYRHRVPVLVMPNGREHGPPFSPAFIARLFG